MDAMIRRRMMMAEAGGTPTPPEPPVVEPVFYDRLVFDGTAYIDTDIITGANDSFRCIFGNETLKAAQRVFGYAAGGGFTSVFYNSSTTKTNRAIAAYYCSSSSIIAKQLAFSSKEFSFYITPKGYGWGSLFYSFTKGSYSPSGQLIIGMNPSHTGQPYTGVTGIFRIYGSEAQNCTDYSSFSNYTPYITLRPCTYDGEAGLWCVETSTFYGNTAGSGILTVLNN